MAEEIRFLKNQTGFQKTGVVKGFYLPPELVLSKGRLRVLVNPDIAAQGVSIVLTDASSPAPPATTTGDTTLSTTLPGNTQSVYGVLSLTNKQPQSATLSRIFEFVLLSATGEVTELAFDFSAGTTKTYATRLTPGIYTLKWRFKGSPLVAQPGTVLRSVFITPGRETSVSLSNFEWDNVTDWASSSVSSTNLDASLNPDKYVFYISNDTASTSRIAKLILTTSPSLLVQTSFDINDANAGRFVSLATSTLTYKYRVEYGDGSGTALKDFSFLPEKRLYSLNSLGNLS